MHTFTVQSSSNKALSAWYVPDGGHTRVNRNVNTVCPLSVYILEGRETQDKELVIRALEGAEY